MTSPIITATDQATVEVRDEATRDIAIRLLPHGEIAERGDYSEEYAPGAHEGTDATTVVVRDGHRRDSMADIVGMGREWEVRDDATWLNARIAETPEGDRALALAKIGALRASAGFTEDDAVSRVEKRGGRRHVIRDRINVVEAGLLTNPAYHSTAVEARQEDPSVTEPIITATPGAADAPVVEERADDRPVLAVATAPAKTMTAAEYAVLHVRAALGDAVARDRIIQSRAAGDQITGTITAGALPVSVAGDLVNKAIRRAPMLSFFSRYSLPDVGMQFVRPQIDQHALVGYQSAELAVVPTQEVKISGTPVNIFTIAGSVNVSKQFVDRTPYWQRVFDDLVVAYANFLDTQLVGNGDGTAALKGLNTTGVFTTNAGWTAVALADIGALTTAAFAASAALADGKHGMGPDAAIMNSTTYASIASILDASKRPIFPAVGATNAPGTASLNGAGGFFGLPVVLDKNVAAKTIFLASQDGCELYTSPSAESPFELALDQPTTLAVATSIYGYAASYFKPESVAKITTA